jgi:signal transduction histidine kinase
MQARWSEKNLTLDLQLAEITIASNEQLLYQVWQNLIGNAIKFSNAGGTLKVVVKQDGGRMYFEVCDDGIGIKDEDKEKIFDHFYMADASRSTDGNGLGLAIVKKILARLGGEIDFESTYGKGSKFFVRV